MWLYKFVLIKVKIMFLSHTSDISQFKSHMWLLASLSESTDIDYFHQKALLDKTDLNYS